MPNLLAAAARAMLTKVRCPNCGAVQARMRKPKPARYRCRKCGHVFQVPAPEKRRSSSQRKRY